jgi:hypothetical protein
MHLIDADILADARGLSVAACGVGLGFGFLVWVMGGWGQRFWVVLLGTVVAGVYGLGIGESFNVQPLVSALLLAVTGGVLALALMRVGAFLAGGMTACLLAGSVFPGWNEPFIFFFAGGFLGLFLLRLWLMVLSSLAGSLVMGYSLLWLLDTLGKLDAVEVAETRPTLLNWLVAGTALFGLLIQIALVRRYGPKKGSDEEDAAGGGILSFFSRRGPAPKKGRKAA